jgi:ketosteroid isomerase-like protein
MTRPIYWHVALLLAVGCTPAPVTDTGALEAELRAAAEAYHSAASGKNATAVVALYDETALMVPPGASMVDGLDGVRGYRFGFIETPGVELSFELIRVEVAESADIAWTLAVGRITIRNPDGADGNDVVRDFHTWRKQADGSWKVVVDIWNSGAPTDG